MMRRALLLITVLAAHALAQPTVAPSPQSTGPTRGENAGGYNITHQFETGYRFLSVDGSLERYRSNVNFGSGIRLLGSRMAINSREGNGRWFDEIVLSTQGLGNDPYQSANLRVQHNKLYRYDMLFRINDYVNPGLQTGTTPGHLLSTRRQWQDHDFTLLPSAPIRLTAGYSRNSQDGPGLTSTQLFDSLGDEYPLFADINRRQREYRLGGEAAAAGFRFVFQRGWQRYEEDSPQRLDTPHPGALTTDLNTVRSVARSEPYSGDTPFWRLHLVQDKKRWFGVGARFTYAGGRRDFRFDELANGVDRRGTDRVRQILVQGSARRPVTSGALTLSLFPSNKATITNHTAYHQVIMDGDSVFQELNNATLGLDLLRFQYLGLRTITNSTDTVVRLRRWVGLYGGYHFSQRRIRSRAGEARAGRAAQVAFHEQDNRIHSGLAGIRLQPIRPVRIVIDGEIGRADRPFFPFSERRYHGFSGRIEYKTDKLTLAATARNSFNGNSVNLFTHSARSRTYAADASWTPNRRFAIDAGYSKQHFDSLTGIAYFAAIDLVENNPSIYISNIHAAHATARFTAGSRVDLSAGFHRVQDTGDGRANPGPPLDGRTDPNALTVFRAVQTFPLTYQSPQAQISVRLNTKLRWNFGYQYYNYDEAFSRAFQYGAHTGFTSIMWSF